MGEAVKLTAKMRHVLCILARHTDEMPLSGPEISQIYWKRVGDRVGLRSSKWSASGLMALRDRGYVEQLGQTFTGAWCWRITEAGRRALILIEERKALAEGEVRP